MRIIPTTPPLGARIEGVDLNRPLPDADFRAVLRALGGHGVLCFPNQDLTPDSHAAFGARFGELDVNVAAAGYHEPDHPEIMILSNLKENGKSLGLGDAGQDWHTDMSYAKVIALANILHARQVPLRNGKPLGETQFRDMHRAYDELPDRLKTRLEGRTATHDFNKYWEIALQRPGTTRKPLTPEQRAKRPPVSHPILLTHPITGRKVLYANPGYTMWIDGMDRAESDHILDFLFRHQMRADFFHAHHWTEGDVLMWDNIGTVHNAVADYEPDEPRYMRRVQVMATLDYAARPRLWSPLDRGRGAPLRVRVFPARPKQRGRVKTYDICSYATRYTSSNSTYGTAKIDDIKTIYNQIASKINKHSSRFLTKGWVSGVNIVINPGGHRNFCDCFSLKL